MDEFYELKQKYKESMDRRKMKIKKNKDLSLKEKQAKIKKLIGRCVNCEKPGGTIFEEKNGMLKAVCGSKTPCILNINIKRKVYDNMREMEQKNHKTTESLKMRIIMTKLDYLFGLINSKDEIVDKFNELKTELAHINEIQLVIQKKYGDILSGVHREPLLVDASLELIQEIDEIKKIYQEYLLEPSQAYLTSMVEKYVTTIQPLTEKIRNINYGYYAIESNVEQNTENIDDEEKAKASTKEKKAVYTLVALPYRMEQLEQERK
jgi:hypothetical protein